MKKAIITVDTEGHVGSDPVRHLIWGETTDGRRCGIPLIMDLCDEVGAKAVFFVDVAEAWHYGEEKIAEVMRYIFERGHDVGVHIHPDHMADNKRLFLYEYSFEEQYNIIKKCTEFYENVLGKKPAAFRAGKYGANRDTIKILTELGYKADFSEFYGQKWCGIKPAITGNKTVQISKKMIEIPVMSYKSHLYNLINRYDKFDTDSTWMEQKFIVNKLILDDTIDPIVVFVHSFSFLNWRSHPNTPRLKKNVSETFRKTLKLLEKNVEFETVSEAIDKSYDDMNYKEASVFTIDKTHSALFFMFKAQNVITQRIDEKIRYIRYGY